MNTNKRWIYLAAGTLIMLFVGLIYAWSIFRAPLTALFPDWTPTQISMTFTVSIVFFCIGGFLGGKVATKIKHRIIVIISAAALLVGFCATSFLLDVEASGRSLAILYVFYGVLGGGGVGLTYNAVLSTVTKWFPGRTGMASGILLMGFGLGGLVLGSIVNVLSTSVGILTTFTVLGIAIAVILLLGSLFIKLPTPDEMKALAPSQKERGGVAVAQDYTLSQMLKTGSFWIFFIWIITLSIGGLLIINSAANIAVAFGAPAVLGLIVAVFNGAGRVIIGAVFDKWGRKTTMAINTLIMVVAGIALFAGATVDSAIFIFIGLPLMGICYGGTPSLTSAITNRFYGQKHFGENYGMATFSLAPAAIIGPLLSSKLQESSGGAYDSTFVMLIVVSIVAFALTLFLTFVSRKERLE